MRGFHDALRGENKAIQTVYMWMQASNPEAQRLRQRAAATSACAVCLGTVTGLNTNSFVHHHAWMMFSVVSLQAGMIARALHLVSQRRQMLQQRIRKS